jgi:hypothetical protein
VAKAEKRRFSRRRPSILVTRKLKRETRPNAHRRDRVFAKPSLIKSERAAIRIIYGQGEAVRPRGSEERQRQPFQHLQPDDRRRATLRACLAGQPCGSLPSGQPDDEPSSACSWKSGAGSRSFPTRLWRKARPQADVRRHDPAERSRAIRITDFERRQMTAYAQNFTLGSLRGFCSLLRSSWSTDRLKKALQV